VRVLTLAAAGAEQLWDELLPLEVKELPVELAALDALLGDPALLAPIADRWEQNARERGRPSIAIETYVRLMVIKHRTGLGYETLVRGCRTRCICGASAGSHWMRTCPTSRRCASSRAGSEPTSWPRSRAC
jgi:hypothetical protein